MALRLASSLMRRPAAAAAAARTPSRFPRAACRAFADATDADADADAGDSPDAAAAAGPSRRVAVRHMAPFRRRREDVLRDVARARAMEDFQRASRGVLRTWVTETARAIAGEREAAVDAARADSAAALARKAARRAARVREGASRALQLRAFLTQRAQVRLQRRRRAQELAQKRAIARRDALLALDRRTDLWENTPDECRYLRYLTAPEARFDVNRTRLHAWIERNAK